MKIYQWVLLGLGVLFLPVLLAPIIPDKPSESLNVEIQEQATAPISEADKKDFAENREDIVSWLRQMVVKEDYVAAVEWGKRFQGIDDLEFRKLYSEAVAGKNLTQKRQAILDEGRVRRAKQFKQAISQTTSSSAADYCQSLVEARLKSPRTAKFEFGPAVIPDQSNFSFNVSSYVDSENAMGGLVRTYYRCSLEYVDGEKWNLVDLDLVE